MSSNIGGFIWGKIWSMWYPFVTSMMKDDSLVFMNYGYASDILNEETLPMEGEDAENRTYCQLYYQVAAQDAAVDLSGLKVLEVSSGHGGGASFLARHLKPGSYTGLERNPKAVEFCTKRHADVSGLSFVQGDAQKMDLPDASYDVILNVEASHSYGSIESFYAEVARVLKPGGHFLTTDFRPATSMPAWREQLVAQGLEILNETDITQNALLSMDIVHDERMDQIRRWAPSWAQNYAKKFAGVQGSDIYEDFKSGERVYVTFALRKPE